MSQRLLVIEEKPLCNDVYDYDGVCHSKMTDEAIEDELVMEWMSFGPDGYYFGPWKIAIEDKALFARIQPALRKAFASTVHYEYPDCIWVFYCEGRTIEHPSEAELKAWLVAA